MNESLKTVKKTNPLMQTLTPYILIAPAMIGILIFTVYPVLDVFYLSFYKTNLINKAKTRFVGLANYRTILKNAAFQKTMVNTVVYTVVMVVAVAVLAMLLAVWLGKKNTGLNRVAQATVFMPHVISMVSVAMIFTQMMEPNFGLFNSLLTKFGLPTSQWLQSSDTAMASILFMSVWKHIGYYVLIFIAAIQSVPQSVLEAAALDNSGEMKTLLKVTLPIISPQVFFVLIVLTIQSFRVFDTIRLTTSGGPNNATSSLVYYIYQQSQVNLDIGTAAAGGVILTVVVGLLTVFYFRGLSSKVHYQ